MAVLYRGDHFLELPILDVSLSGIRLYTTNHIGLTPDRVLPIALPECGVHDAQVVAGRSQSVAFRFMPPEPNGLRSIIDAWTSKPSVRS
jgi:hypothetical protein